MEANYTIKKARLHVVKRFSTCFSPIRVSILFLALLIIPGVVQGQFDYFGAPASSGAANSPSSPSSTFGTPPAPAAAPATFSGPTSAAPISTAPVRQSASTLSTETSGSASREPSPQQLRDQPELLRSVMDRNHPFVHYYAAPNYPNALIQGKSLSVAELLSGISSPQQRAPLLKSYWTLAGLLIEFNIRIDAESCIQDWYKQASNSSDTQRANLMKLALPLAQQERKAVEVRFVQLQWQLAQQLRQIKGVALNEQALPIPCDLPLYKKYETYLEKIAHSDRARTVGRMIPVQQQLIDARLAGCNAAGLALKSAALSARESLQVLQQRTESFAALVDAVVQYNMMIAEYTSETVGYGVSQYRLIGALIELPNYASTLPVNRHTNENPRSTQVASPPAGNHFSSAPQQLPGNPMRSELPTSPQSAAPQMTAPQMTAPQMASAQMPGPAPQNPAPSAGFSAPTQDYAQQIPVQPAYASEQPSMTPPLPPRAGNRQRQPIQPVTHISSDQ